MQAGEHWLAIIILLMPGLLLIEPAILQVQKLISLDPVRKFAAIQVDLFGTGNAGTEIFWPFYYPAPARPSDRGALRLS